MLSKLRYLSIASCVCSFIADSYSTEIIEDLSVFDSHKILLTQSDAVSELYQIIYDIHTLFDKHHITYWADGGTLLGCVRHQGIIPWDDDLDIGIKADDVSRVFALKSDLEGLGYEIMPGLWPRIQLAKGPIAKVHYGEYWIQETRIPWIDVFPFKVEKEYYIHDSSHAASLWIHDRFSVNNIKNKKLAAFCDFNIWIPDQAEDLLKNYYGKDVLDYGFYEGNHINHGRVKYRWKLGDTDRLPAQPAKILNKKSVK